jgi:hypothetical protein
MKFNLLTIGNPKTAKGETRGYLTAILHLAPYNVAGINVCPMAELAGCAAGCLNTAGRGGIAKDRATFAPHGVTVPANSVQRARIRRTRAFAENRGAFMAELATEIRKAQKVAIKHGLRLAVRLNGTSDIAWENLECGGAANVFALFPEVQFYDYTKLATRTRTVGAIANYHLTLSYSQASPLYLKSLAKADQAANLAVVFDTARGAALPATFNGRAVVDGDETDLRFLDPAGVVVGLRAKGAAKRDASGFVVRLSTIANAA